MLLYYYLCALLIIILLAVFFYRYVYEGKTKQQPVRDIIKEEISKVLAKKPAEDKGKDGEGEKNTDSIPDAINRFISASFEKGHVPVEHEKISCDVYKRLLLRYSILEKTAGRDNLVLGLAETSSDPKSQQGSSNRRYHLAVTDLFVEKAIAYLEKQANRYKIMGWVVYAFAGVVALAGMGVSGYKFFSYESPFSVKHYEKYFDFVGKINSNPEIAKSILWSDLVYSTTRGIVMYGMVIFVVVGFWRYGKALLDQAERLLEKRHALRQGRLFVHLNDGELTIDQLERAFNWNQTQPNAFGELKVDASVMNNITDGIIKMIPDMIKSVKDKGEGEDKGKNSKGAG